MKKGLFLLIAVTIAGSSCFADNLYDSGKVVPAITKTPKIIHTIEIDELRKKYFITPDDFNLSLQIAALLYKDDKYNESMNQLDSDLRMAKDNPDKLNEFKEIVFKRIESDPEFEFNYIALGKFYRQQGDHEASFIQYQKAAKLAPSNVILQIEVAKKHQRNGEYTKAIAIYDKVLRKNPYFKGIIAFRGDCYYELGEIEKAEADYRAGLAMEPEFSNSAIGLYKCLKNNRSVSAIFKEIYPIYKTKPITSQNYIDFVAGAKYYVNVSTDYKDARFDVKEIIRIYNEVLKIDPLNTVAYGDLEYFYKEQNDYKNMKNLLYKCMTPVKDKKTGELKTVDYPSVQIASTLANMSPNLLIDAQELIKTNHKKEAAELLDRIKEETPEICLLKAQVFSDLEYQDNSIFWHKKALEFSPNNTELLYSIAKEYEKMMEYDPAKEYIRQALIIDPKNKKYTKLQENIIIAQNDELIKMAHDHLGDEDNQVLSETIDKLFSNPYLNAEAYIIGGLVKQKFGDENEALLYFVKAIELDSKNVLALRLAAERYEAQDQNQAVKYYKQCVLAAKDPNDPDAQYAASKLLELNQVVPVNYIKK